MIQILEEEENISVNEEHKYNNNNTDPKIKSTESKIILHGYDHGHSRVHHSHSHKKRHQKRINWDQYPAFKPHHINGRKVISNKYTIWIESIKPNTTYLFKLRYDI